MTASKSSALISIFAKIFKKMKTFGLHARAGGGSMVIVLASSFLPAGYAQVIDTGDKVGIGVTEPLEKLHINGSIRGGQFGGALRISTGNGYLDLGPRNTGWAHLETDRPLFYFSKSIHIDGALSSYNTLNLNFQTNGFSRMTILNSNGNIGIGTLIPTARLHIPNGDLIVGGGESLTNNLNATLYVKSRGDNSTTYPFYIGKQSSGQDLFWVRGDGNGYFLGNLGIGTGTGNPAAKLHISGGHLLIDAGSNSKIFTGTGTSELNRYLELLNSPGLQSASGFKAGGILVSDQYSYANPGKNDLVVKGNVSVGTASSQGYKMTIAGKAIAEEVVVKLQANWPDYVFDNEYNLASLSKVEEFIRANKHLPDVPTADEVKANGLSLGEMNAILLKKVEELTLYVIEKQKEIKGLKKGLTENK